MKLTAILVEILGISVVATGIGIELAYGGAIHLIVITVGSCLVAIGGIIWGKFIRGGK